MTDDAHIWLSHAWAALPWFGMLALPFVMNWWERDE